MCYASENQRQSADWGSSRLNQSNDLLTSQKCKVEVKELNCREEVIGVVVGVVALD